MNQNSYNKYPLAGKTINKSNSRVKIGKDIFGYDKWPIIAGPASIESYEQTYKVITYLSDMKIRLICGNIYAPDKLDENYQEKLNSSIEIVKKLKTEFDFYFSTEIHSASFMEILDPIVDVWQVGVQSMVNYELLKILSETNKTIILKRGTMATIEEWLLAAEYLLNGGNEQVILCEQGIRSFDSQSRIAFDINAIPLVKDLSHLPLIGNPCYAAANKKYIPQLAKAILISGGNGLMLDVCHKPENKLKSYHQCLSFREFEELINGLETLKMIVKIID